MGRKRMKKYIRIAIAYDFDGTLAPDNMQERNFIPKLGIEPAKFWKRVRTMARKNDMDEILAYMQLMIKEGINRGIKIDKRAFKKYGKGIKTFKGVKRWFTMIKNYAKKKGVIIEHYIISSGLREMIDGTSIKKHFNHIFASGFKYDQHDVAEWPALAVNYTNKTQYLFRISKGVMNSHENRAVNKYIPQDKRSIPFTNIIYIGDGETDIPCLKVLKLKGGHSIVVYPPRKRRARKNIEKLIKRKIADCGFVADYSSGSKLDKAVKSIIDLIVARENFKINSRG